jgi:hypothetical protein
MMHAPAMSHRSPTLSPLQRLLAAGAVALILALTVLAVSPTLHAWLHGESQLDPNDSCAVVLFAHGLTPALAALVLLALALAPPRAVFPLPAPILAAAPAFDLPPGCGPPAS